MVFWSFLLSISLCLARFLCHELIWVDDFDGVTLDSESWNIKVLESPSVGLQAYTSENYYIKDSVLSLVVRKERKGPRNYTSAYITTQGKRDFFYGKFEIKMKIPDVRGVWIHFHILPTGKDSASPLFGEIDIVNSLIKAQKTNSFYLHVSGSGNTKEVPLPTDFSTNFHKIWVRWEPGKISFYIDDNFVFNQTNQELKPWPFDNGTNFYIALGLGIGGMQAGDPDPEFSLATCDIQKVSVFQKFEDQPVFGENTPLYYPGKEILAKSLGNFSKTLWTDCYEACSNVTGSSYFTWTGFNGGTCFCKEKVNIRKPKSLAAKEFTHSGKICTLRTNLDVRGRDIGSQNAQKASECCAYCAKTPGCRAFRWESAKSNCLFKSEGIIFRKTGAISWSAL